MIDANPEEKYLTDMPTEIMNEYGLTKTLLTRRETIYLKHVLKNLFIYGDEEYLESKLKILNFSSTFKYFSYITDKLRGIYKLPRAFRTDEADSLVKQSRNSFIKMLELYKETNPIIVLDFDKTITNTKFHSLYEYFTEQNYKIIINSANPNQEVIENYLTKHGLKTPSEIYANKGKKRKITRLKEIAASNTKKVIFYIDDEVEYLEYGCLLFMYCYEYTKDGKIYNRTIFKK